MERGEVSSRGEDRGRVREIGFSGRGSPACPFRARRRPASQIATAFVAFFLLAAAGSHAQIVQAPLLSAPVPAISGTWAGVLAVSGLRLPLVFNIEAAPGWEGSTLDSPGQGVKGIPISSVRLIAGEPPALRFAVSVISAYFEGILSGEGESLSGSWNQGGSSLPLTLLRASKPFALDRPQEPRPPFPYRIDEVRIPSLAPGVTLAATFVLPAGDGPFPAIVMVSGSGAQNRDEEILGHKPFLVLADYLARRGIASLRYDDRGFAASTGDFSQSTSLDFALDARAVCGWLLRRPEVACGRVGIVGHSEGGIIAPIVASLEPGIGFLVLLAAPGLPGTLILESQASLIARASGRSEEAIRESAKLNERLYAEALQNLPEEELALSVRTVFMEGISAMNSMSPEEKVEALQGATRVAMQLTSPWFRTFLALDPAEYLAKLSLPVLALNGSKDLQVPGRENLDAIRSALTEDSRSRFILLDGLNHLFQHAGSGSPEEYGEIRETFAPEVLGLIADWILDPGA